MKTKHIQIMTGPKGPVEVYVFRKESLTDKFFAWLTKVSIKLDTYLYEVREARFKKAWDLAQKQNGTKVVRGDERKA